MTLRQPEPAGPWPTAAWSMVLLTTVALGVSVVGRVLSPTLLLDLVSLWPVPAAAAIASVVAILSSAGRVRAIAPLLLVTWLIGGTGLHLTGWTALPSASAAVTGPEIVASRATLTISLGDAEVVVGRGDELRAAPRPIGGSMGAPVVEVSGADPRVVGVTSDRSSPWFRFGVLDVTVPAGPEWSLVVDADVFDLDLVELDVIGVELLSGAGTLRLGDAVGPAEVQVLDRAVIFLPAGTPASVTGEASVPPSWAPTEEGSRSPVSGDGWTITAAPGSTLEIRES